MIVASNGSITRLEDRPRSKCRRWRLRVYLGISPLTGKRKEKTRRFSGTYSAAKAALRDFAQELNSGVDINKMDTLFCDHARRWFEQRSHRVRVPPP